MHVEEIKLYNMLKFHKILSSGMAIIMGKKFTIIRIMHFALYYTQDGILTLYKSTKNNNRILAVGMSNGRLGKRV